MSKVFAIATFFFSTLYLYAGNETTIGNFTYGTDEDGNSYTKQKVGNFTYGNSSNGDNWTEQKVGNFTYGNSSDGESWTKQKIGNFNYGNSSDGTSWTEQKVGNFTYGNASNGSSWTKQRIGNSNYTNYSEPEKSKLETNNYINSIYEQNDDDEALLRRRKAAMQEDEEISNLNNTILLQQLQNSRVKKARDDFEAIDASLSEIISRNGGKDHSWDDKTRIEAQKFMLANSEYNAEAISNYFRSLDNDYRNTVLQWTDLNWGDNKPEHVPFNYESRKK